MTETNTRWTFADSSPVMNSYGLNGVTRNGTCSTSTRDKQDAIDRLEDGALFLDRHDIAPDIFARWVISGPMVDVKQTEPLDRCLVPDYMVPALGGSFKTLAKAQQQSDAPGPLDTLSIGAFCDFWVALGAVVYQKCNGELNRLES